MKTKLLFLALSLSLLQIANSQSFVDTSNEWYISDCSSNFQTGEIACDTKKYYFDEVVTLNNLQYHKLFNPDNADFFYGKFYREENGKVYMKETESQEEFLIYDFTALPGDQIEIGSSSSALLIEVLEADSLTLNSGEKRKRMKVARANNHNVYTYWIEGIGSELAPMNTVNMFIYDTWNELGCYISDGTTEYQLGYCMITTETLTPHRKDEFKVFPNPTTDILHIEWFSDKKIIALNVFDFRGSPIYDIMQDNPKFINLSLLPSGTYFVKATLDNGTVKTAKVVKI